MLVPLIIKKVVEIQVQAYRCILQKKCRIYIDYTF